MSSCVPRSVCCGLDNVRYVTIQAEGSSAAIKVGKLLVKVALPRCDDSTVASDVCIQPLNVNIISAPDLSVWPSCWREPRV